MPDDEKDSKAVSPIPQTPARPGTIPTAAGVFPQSVSGGGLRRKRRPHLDLRLVDAQALLTDQGNLLETAWGIIANAFGGDWSKASPEWVGAAEAWRDQYFAQGKLEGVSADAADIFRNVGDREKSKFAEIQRASGVLTPEASIAKFEAAGTVPASTVTDFDLDAFMVRLSALPPALAQKELPNWNGDDETFMDAAVAQWATLHPELGEAVGGPRVWEDGPPAGNLTLGGTDSVELVEAAPIVSRGAVMEDDDEPAPAIALVETADEDAEEVQNLGLPDDQEAAPADKVEEAAAESTEGAPDAPQEAPGTTDTAAPDVVAANTAAPAQDAQPAPPAAPAIVPDFVPGPPPKRATKQAKTPKP